MGWRLGRGRPLQLLSLGRQISVEYGHLDICGTNSLCMLCFCICQLRTMKFDSITIAYVVGNVPAIIKLQVSRSLTTLYSTGGP